MTAGVGRKSSSKSDPEVLDWCTCPNRDRKERDSKTKNEYGGAKKEAPEMDDWKDAVQEQYSEGQFLSYWLDDGMLQSKADIRTWRI